MIKTVLSTALVTAVMLMLTAATGHSEVVKEFFMNGNLHWEKNYKNGVPEGVTREYYQNGSLKSETHFQNGKETGVSRHYYEDGTVMQEVYYNAEGVSQSGITGGEHTQPDPQGRQAKKGKSNIGRAVATVLLLPVQVCVMVGKMLLPFLFL